MEGPEWGAGRKPSSVPSASIRRTEAEGTTIHLARRLPGASSDQPGSRVGRATPPPLFGLAPGGVCLADPVTRAAGELLPHPFTLTAGQRPTADYSLLHFPRVAPPGRYPAPVPCGARTFLEPSKGPRPSHPLPDSVPPFSSRASNERQEAAASCFTRIRPQYSQCTIFDADRVSATFWGGTA